MKIRKILAVFISVLFCIVILSGCIPQTNGKIKIGVIQFTQFPVIDSIRKSITQRMIQLGYIDGVNSEFEYRNANGDFAAANAIVDEFIQGEKDIIISISTPATMVAAKASDKIPVVFAAVSDPVGAGIVDSLEDTGKNITGTSDPIQIAKNFDLAFLLTPNIKKLGYIYNPAEKNSIKSLEEIKEYLKGKNVELVESKVNTPDEVPDAAKELIKNVDAIFILNDNTVATAMPLIGQMAIDAKIPAYVAGGLMVSENGLAHVGIKYDELGKETANMAAQILGKEKQAKNISVKTFDDDLYTYINLDTADKIGVTIPNDILGAPNTILYMNTNNYNN
ncbi:MAG TPA: ABC transporter substrate-binding protein [Oscillospiraceae bacterium]|nr:ABC transporter substrate-binding protein [Oscillospiraceae bacterium]